jgi:hypothetical protein
VHEASGRHATEDACRRAAAQVAAGDALRDGLPFAWAREATARLEAGELDVCGWLRERALHLRGVWKRQCSCGWAGPFGRHFPDLPCDSDALELAWGRLAVGHVPPLAPPPVPPAAPPHDWVEYYALRRLPAASPAGACLDGPLTLLAALRVAGVLPQASVHAERLVVHWLGPRKELDQLPLFLEAVACLPCPLDLVMFGPDVPRARDGAHAASPCGRLRVMLCSTAGGYTGEEASDGARALGRPALVFAPNAGVAAYPKEWTATRVAMARPWQPPLVVSDYTEEAALMAQEFLEAGGGLRLVQPTQLNPFRGLLGSAGGVHCALPAYSNGWLVCLKSAGQQS